MTRAVVELAHDDRGAVQRFELELPRGHVAFEGHFEGAPVFPAAVLVDEVLERVERAWPADGRVRRVRSLKLHEGLRPGDRIAVVLTRHDPHAVGVEVTRGEARVASATLVLDDVAEEDAGPPQRFCAIVPTYDNPETVRRVVTAVRRHVSDVIVVDDGSADAGRTACAELGRDGLALVVRRPHNGGKGAAVKDGLRRALELGFTHALQIDADDQHDADDIPLLLAASRAEPRALVTGKPSFDRTAPRARVWGRKITQFWGRVETGGRLDVDSLCGYRVYPVREALASGTRGDRMDFDPEIVVRLAWRGAPVVLVPTRVRYLRAEEGGVSHFRMVKDNALISWMHTRLCVTAILRAVGVER